MAGDRFATMTAGVSQATRRALLELRRLINQTVPVGTVQAFAGTTAPDGWLACDGSAVSRTVYAALFEVIGTTYGAGDGSTTFNLPDLRNRFIAGKGTVAWSNVMGETGGSKDAVVVSHDHTINHGHADTFAVASLGTTNVTSSSDSHSHTATTSTDSHSHGPTGRTHFVVQSTGGGYGAATAVRADANATYGATSVTVTSTDSHSHTLTTSTDSHSHTTNIAHGHSLTGTVTNHTGSSGTTGVAATDANLPPYLTLLYMVKT